MTGDDTAYGLCHSVLPREVAGIVVFYGVASADNATRVADQRFGLLRVKTRSALIEHTVSGFAPKADVPMRARAALRLTIAT
jgi:hypothetical protein